LSEEAQRLLGRLADRLGLTKTSVLEMAIRKLAYAELGEEETAVDPRTHSTPPPRELPVSPSLPVKLTGEYVRPVFPVTEE